MIATIAEDNVLRIWDKKKKPIRQDLSDFTGKLFHFGKIFYLLICQYPISLLKKRIINLGNSLVNGIVCKI